MSTEPSISFSPDGKILASGSEDKTIRLWDVTTKQPIGDPLQGHKNSVRNVLFSPDGKLLVSQGDPLYPSGVLEDGIRLWDVATRQSLDKLLQCKDSVNNMMFSPDGKILAIANKDGTICLWDVTNRKFFDEPLLGGGNWVISFSPDGKILASKESGSGSGSTYLWDMTTRQLIGEPLRHDDVMDDVSGISFSPDGKLLASGWLSDRIIFWDVATGQPIGQPLLGNKGAITSVSFSPDGKLLASGSSEIVYLWDMSIGTDTQSWINKACDIVNRNMTLAEWQEFFPDKPYYPTCPYLPLPEGVEVDLSDLPTATPSPTPFDTPTPSATDTPTVTPQLPTATVPPDSGVIILQGDSSLANLESQVQWVDGAGQWYNVDNWRKSLDSAGSVSWLVWPDQFNKGPFRWVVYQADGSVRFESQPFNLPGAGEEYVVEVE